MPDLSSLPYRKTGLYPLADRITRMYAGKAASLRWITYLVHDPSPAWLCCDCSRHKLISKSWLMIGRQDPLIGSVIHGTELCDGKQYRTLFTDWGDREAGEEKYKKFLNKSRTHYTQSGTHLTL